MSLNNIPNTKINEIRQNVDLEYSEELKLNIRCDDDDSHVAVLYCIKCETSLCKVCSDSYHSRRAVSNHKIVRLTEKPEQPIYCHSHPDKTAELICKEPTCEGTNQPICFTCHLYKAHKNHKYEMIEDEYDKIRTNIENCLKEIKKKQEICENNSNECNNCISTYTPIDDGSLLFSVSPEIERDEIREFYSNAEKLALEKFDKFVNSRIRELNSLKDEYERHTFRLNDMSSELRNMKDMKKIEVIKNGKNVEKLWIQSAKNIDKITNLIPFKSYNTKYPKMKSMNIEIEYSRKTTAIYFFNHDKYVYARPKQIFNSKVVLKTDYKEDGRLYKYIDGRSILHLNSQPFYCTIDLSVYEYTAVMWFRSDNEMAVSDRLKDLIECEFWKRIIVIMPSRKWKNNEDIVHAIEKTAVMDHRVKFVKYTGFPQILDALFGPHF